MKKFILKVLIFLVISIALFCGYAYLGGILARRIYGMPVAEQIDISFSNALNRNYNTVFLGNSRVYHGINPEKFSDNAYNFAHDNDSFNQCYYKLKYLIDNNIKVNSLFLGVDYFEFGIFSSTRNYCYDKYFEDEYKLDYNSNLFKEHIDNYQRIFFNHQFILIKSLLKIITNKGRFPDSNSYIKPNGQYIMYGSKGSPKDEVTRNSLMLPIQKEYFKRILTLCRNNDIKCVLFMMPVRDGEMKSYTNDYINEFSQWIASTIKPYNIKYYDMSQLDEFKDYTLYDDITHFNERGANLFSSYFNELLMAE